MTLQTKYEQQLLGRIISDRDVYYQNSDMITADLFVIYPEVFQAYIEQIEAGHKPTVTRIIHKCPDLRSDIGRMVSGVAYDIPMQEVIEQLMAERTDRIINNAMIQAGMSDDKVKVLTDAITEVYRMQSTDFHTAGDIATRLINSIKSGRHKGIITGYRYLDQLTGGLQKGDLVIIAGETSQGKTSLALNIAECAITNGHAVCIITLEMTDEQLLARMISSYASVSFADKDAFVMAASDIVPRYMELPLVVPDVRSNSTAHIAGLIRAAVIRYRCEVVVIDYLQLIQDKTRDGREQEIGRTARTMKNLAKELGINIIAVSQLNRDRGRPYPTLSRLRDSGQIEEAADIVMFIFRPEAYGEVEYKEQPTEGLAELIIAKGRNYGTGSFFVRFEKEYTRFLDDHVRRGDAGITRSATVEEGLPF